MAITRRRFLEYSGGLALAFAAGRVLAIDPRNGKPKMTPSGFDPNVFVHVATDGLVTLVCARSEMGQGVRSTIPALLADELGADMARVKLVQGDADKKYGDQKTDGSTSIRKGYEGLRQAGATARTMLVAAAARRWKVSPASCVARDHAIFHGKLSLGFGELAAEAAMLPVPAPGEVKVRPRSEMRHVFKDLPLIDGPAIVTGKAVFGADVRLPGMLVAVIARPPVVGGRVARYDAKRALAIPGVKHIVEIPTPKPPYAYQPWGGIAVLAENTWAALRGRAALEIEWDEGANAEYDSDRYRATLSESVHAKGSPARNTGNVEAA
ncbi:MAG: xanthine dehydrogenase family protein molybdopterin-binding subunit, partial [Deltaproteobacteria bacterium]